MTRPVNVSRALAATHPLDIMRLQRTVRDANVGALSDTEVERLWMAFSRMMVEIHSGSSSNGLMSWWTVDEDSLRHFGEWLKI